MVCYNKMDNNNHNEDFDIIDFELNEYDDEFAKDVSEFDTLDELKADIRKAKEERSSG